MTSGNLVNLQADLTPHRCGWRNANSHALMPILCQLLDGHPDTPLFRAHSRPFQQGFETCFKPQHMVF